MKKVLMFALAAAFAAGCGSKQNIVSTEELSVEKTLEQAEQFVGKNITAVGIVGHVCGHGGDKMFLTNEDGTKRLKVIPSGDLQSFSPEMEGSVYKVTGILEEMRIDEEYLSNWEKEFAEKDHESEGHDHSHHGEKADMGEHTDAQTKISKYREELAASGKPYLAFYTLKAIKVEKVEEAKESNGETQSEIKEQN